MMRMVRIRVLMIRLSRLMTILRVMAIHAAYDDEHDPYHQSAQYEQSGVNFDKDAHTYTIIHTHCVCSSARSHSTCQRVGH